MSSFFRGTSEGQDGRFSNKDKKLMSGMKFEPVTEKKVNMNKVDKTWIPKWVTDKVTELLNFEDEVLISYVENILEEEKPDPKLLQLHLTGFLNAKNARLFTASLWEHLVSAQDEPTGFPTQLLEAKKEEMRAAEAEKEALGARLRENNKHNERISDEVQVRKSRFDSAATQLPPSGGLPPPPPVPVSLRPSDGDVSPNVAVTASAKLQRSTSKSQSPVNNQSRSRSRSRSLHRRSRSRSRSPRRRRRSRSPLRRRSRSPPRGNYRRRSRSPPRRRSRSPPRRRSRSPPRRRSRSPPRRRSRSPPRRRSRSPPRRRSRSPPRRRSRSPPRRRSRSPPRRRSRSPPPARSRRLSRSKSPTRRSRSSSFDDKPRRSGSPIAGDTRARILARLGAGSPTSEKIDEDPQKKSKKERKKEKKEKKKKKRKHKSRSKSPRQDDGGSSGEERQLDRQLMAQDCKTFSSVTPANHFTTTETTRRESLDPLITESKSPTQASSFWDRKFTPFGIRSKFKEAAALLVGTSREASAAPHRELQDVSSETSSDIAELPEGTTAFSGLSPLEAAALNRNLASANALLKQESAELHEQELELYVQKFNESMMINEKMTAMSVALEVEAGELAQQARIAEIEAREQLEYPESASQNDQEGEEGNDTFSRIMKEEGLLHVGSEGLETRLTSSMLPPALDIGTLMSQQSPDPMLTCKP